MTSDWSFIWSPQFVVGTVIAGLLLNVASTLLVRAGDGVWTRLSKSSRRAQSEESGRVEQLTAAATSDSALYAALAAEASRLRVHQLLRFFIAFVFTQNFVLLFAFGEVKPGMSIVGVVCILFLMLMGFIFYDLGLETGQRARRLDVALRAVQRNRKLPIMD